MRVRYTTLDSSQDDLESLPWLPLILTQGHQRVEAVGLVDSGATISVLPYEIGVQLGAAWDERHAVIRLTGNLGSYPAMPLVLAAVVGSFPQVTLAFAWTQAPGVPLVLGQMNFLLEFDVCFYRARLEFDIKQAKPKRRRQRP